ncbi:MAG: anti-sigma factor family protein [bacterium]
MKNTSKELEEYLAAMVDGEYIDDSTRQELQSRLENDPELSAALYIQTAMKSMLRTNQEALHIDPPVELRASIMNGIRSQQSQERQVSTKGSLIESFWNALDPIVSVLRPTFAVPLIAIICIGVYAFMSETDSIQALGTSSMANFEIIHAGENNICSQAYATFHAYEDGSLPLQMISTDQKKLSAFFNENGVKYPVHFPKIDAELIGGVVSQEKGTKFAHFIYKVGDHLIYAYEVPEGLVDNQTLSVNPRAMEIVKKADWYWEQEKGASNTMVLWRLGSNLCVMVSDLRTEQLSALLHVEET